jgi:hypothetical protein
MVLLSPPHSAGLVPRLGHESFCPNPSQDKHHSHSLWNPKVHYRRSRKPSGQRHDLSSLAQTPGPWVRIPLWAWMFSVCCCVFLCLCTGRGLATSWSPVQGVLPTVLDRVTEVKQKFHGGGQGLNWAVEPKGGKRSITVFTRTVYWALSWTRWMQSTSSHPVSWRCILILSRVEYVWL